MLDNLIGIYCILNTKTKKVYIGSAINLRNRIYQHKNHLKYKRHPNKHLQRAYDLYGVENFNFRIIELTNKDKLLKREQLWINYFNSSDLNFGYNIVPLAGSRLGTKHTEETKKALKGRVMSKEAKEKMSLAKLGKSRSKETKIKIGIFNKGKRLSQEHKQRISLAKKGKKQSPEHLAKLTAIRRAKAQKPEILIMQGFQI